ncbi:esterase family protein [Antrihabitans sp. YC3-6]|uniref:Esterase family protein n=1 Tax=Antrihabitans stalagmiti TaxID=2799499 RepID=A0A934U3X6_9NOCA|nr:alpha/beta hydrolase family protein [Antrihabitans stalagmiti]MBJ8340020.1 esterase family protein [Antrihabitans stalagmiti]
MGRRFFATASLALALVLSGGVPSAVGAPIPALPRPGGPATVVSVDELTPTRSALFIDSPAMGRIVQVQVLHPASEGPRPSFYLLDGVDSTDDESSWTKKTDIVDFVAGKNVNVVLPVGGMASYYTDWQKADPALGVNMWETFLTKELPPIIDGEMNGNGVRAIGGLSMGGQAALILTSRNPDLYRGSFVFSACPDTGSPASQNLVRVTVASRGGDATNMWGPASDPDWQAHDPWTNAERLRGKVLYMSVGNGVPGNNDFQGDIDAATVLSEGAPLEVGALICTKEFQSRLDSLGIPAQFVYRPIGTHSWPYWQDDLHDAWPTIESALTS